MQDEVPSHYPPLSLAVAQRLIQRDVARRILSELAADRFHAWRRENHHGRVDAAREMVSEAVTFARAVAGEYAAQEA